MAATKPDASNLRCYYKLDEASGTRVDSHSGVDLTDNNTVGCVAGKIGNAADFTPANNEYLEAADDAAHSLTNKLSVCFFAQIDNLAVNLAFFTKWQHGTATEYAMQTSTSDNDEIRMYIAVNANDAGTTYGTTTDANLAADTWYHFVLVYDGEGADNAARLKLYIDNVAKTLAFNGTIPASLQDGAAPFRIGAFSGSLTRYFDGPEDEFSFWAAALSADEAEWLYNGGSGRTYNEIINETVSPGASSFGSGVAGPYFNRPTPSGLSVVTLGPTVGLAYPRPLVMGRDKRGLAFGEDKRELEMGVDKRELVFPE